MSEKAADAPSNQQQALASSQAEEEEIKVLRKKFEVYESIVERLLSSATEYCQSGSNSYASSHAFVTDLYEFESIYRDPNLLKAINIFRELQALQFTLNQQIDLLIGVPLRQFVKVESNALKTLGKQHSKLREKLSKAEQAAEKEKNTQKKAKLETEQAEVKATYELTKFSFLSKMIETTDRKPYDVSVGLGQVLYSYHSFFNQGNQQLKSLETLLRDIQTEYDKQTKACANRVNITQHVERIEASRGATLRGSSSGSVLQTPPPSPSPASASSNVSTPSGGGGTFTRTQGALFASNGTSNSSGSTISTGASLSSGATSSSSSGAVSSNLSPHLTALVTLAGSNPTSSAAVISGVSPRGNTTPFTLEARTDREGYLYIQPPRRPQSKWKKRWCVVHDGTFSAYPSWNYSQKECKAKFTVNLLLAAVKPVPHEHPFAFQLLSPDQTQTIHASSQREFEDWIATIQNAIAARLRLNQQRIVQNQSSAPKGNLPLAQGWEFKSTMHLKALTEQGSSPTDEIMADPSNAICADCDRRGTQWVSLNLCVVICTDCSAAHRKLGTHISKIRSLGLDKWEPQALHLLRNLGNAKANKVWEAHVSSDVTKPNAEADWAARDKWLTLKYKDRKFVEPAVEHMAQRAISSMLLDAALSTRYEDMLQLFAQGGDVNWVRDNQTGASALHELVAAGNIVCADFFIQNGADIEALDTKGNTPLHFAAQFDHAASARLLLLRGASHTKQNYSGQTPLQVAERHQSTSAIALLQAVLEEEQMKQQAQQLPVKFDKNASGSDSIAEKEPKKRGMLRTIMSFGGATSKTERERTASPMKLPDRIATSAPALRPATNPDRISPHMRDLSPPVQLPKPLEAFAETLPSEAGRLKSPRRMERLEGTLRAAYRLAGTDSWTAWLMRDVRLLLQDLSSPTVSLSASPPDPARDLVLSAALTVRQLTNGPTNFCFELAGPEPTDAGVRFCFYTQALHASWMDVVNARANAKLLPPYALPVVPPLAAPSQTLPPPASPPRTPPRPTDAKPRAGSTSA